MNRDDIIRMARESKVAYICNVNPASQAVLEGLEAFAVLVAAAEREACARMFDMPDYLNGEQEDWFREVAATIRARGEG